MGLAAIITPSHPGLRRRFFALPRCAFHRSFLSGSPWLVAVSGSGERSRRGQRRVGVEGRAGARVRLFENLEAGANLDNIMQWYDGLDRDQVKAVIEFAARSLDKAPASAL